jgi:hypothetical protein
MRSLAAFDLLSAQCAYVALQALLFPRGTIGKQPGGVVKQQM